MLKTLHLDASNPAAIQQAAALLRRGNLVAFATETVYGLGANALSVQAVAAIFAAKQRPAWDPLIVHLASPEQLAQVTQIPSSLSARIQALVSAFWPGPLTLLLPRSPAIPDAVTAGRDLVAVRVPHHPAAQALLAAAALPIAAAAFHSAQNIAFHEVGRQAILADPDFHDGRYRDHGVIPARGLGVARMTAHITYLSETALSRKFGRRIQGDAALGGALFGDRFAVESYLEYQGSSFVRRFDANSYLCITRAMDFFDLAADHGGTLAAAFASTRTRFLLVSFSSDWLFPTAQSRAIARALNQVAANASFVEIISDKGHDAFLLDEPDLARSVAGFLAGCAETLGLER